MGIDATIIPSQANVDGVTLQNVGGVLSVLSISNAELGADAVEEANIKDGEVTHAKLGTSSVETGNILDATILGGDLAAGVLPIELIATAPFTTASAISISSIPAGYKRFILYVRQIAGATGALLLTFNDDTGANYDQIRLTGDGSTALTAAATGSTSMDAIINMKAVQSSATVNISNDNSAVTKTVQSLNVSFARIDLAGGNWNNTADEINKITMTATSSNATGMYMLYGMKG